MAPFITERFALVAGLPHVANTFYARIVRAVQLSVQEYLQQVGANIAEGVTGVPLPSFTAMLQDLKRGTFHISANWVAIPDEYLSVPPAAGGSVRSSPSSAPSTVSESTRSSVSTLTGGDTTRAPVAREENPAPDTEFSTITLRPGGIRNALRVHRPPRNDAGNKFCVAWWTKSACFANCGRRNTHAPFANPAERARLLTYVRKHLAVPTSAT